VSPVALFRWGPVAAWMAVLFALSHSSAPPGASLVPDWASHGGAYALLGLLCHRALRGRAHALLLSVLLATAYGVTDEYHQSFVSARHAEAADVGKDFAGAVAGASLYSAWLSHLRREHA
jgi:VanZ family protein